jgi:hypothetical protein
MIIGNARVSTREQNLGLRHDELKPALDASVDPSKSRSDDTCPPDELKSIDYGGPPFRGIRRADTLKRPHREVRA